MPENNEELMNEETVTEEVTGELAENSNEVPNGKGNKVVKILLAGGLFGLMALGITVFAKKVVAPKIKEHREKKFHKLRDFEDGEEIVEEEE